MTTTSRLHMCGALTLVALTAEALFAQPSADVRTLRFERVQAATQTPSGASPTVGTQIVAPSLLAAIVNKDKLVRASLGFTRGTGNVEWNPWFAASGTLNDNDATAPVVLADLSGMRTTAKLAAGLNAQHWKWSVNVKAQKDLCLQFFRDTLKVKAALRAPIRAALQESDAATRESRLGKVVDSLAQKECNTASFEHAGDRANLLRQADVGRIYLLGAGVEYGRQVYKFADTLAATFASQTESPVAAAVGGGIYFPEIGVLASGTIRAERSFSAGAPRQYCIRTGAAPSLQCQTVSLSGPSASRPVLATAEMRWFANGAVGISPRFTVDLRGDQGTGVELPILLRQIGDVGFASALALGWRSKRSDPSVDDRAYVSLTVGVNYGIGLTLLK